MAAGRRALGIERGQIDVRRDACDRVSTADQRVALGVQEELGFTAGRDEPERTRRDDGAAFRRLLLFGYAVPERLFEHPGQLPLAARKLAHHPDRDLGVALQHRVEGRAVDAHQLDVRLRAGRCGSRKVLEHTHLA